MSFYLDPELIEALMKMCVQNTAQKSQKILAELGVAGYSYWSDDDIANNTGLLD